MPPTDDKPGEFFRKTKKLTTVLKVDYLGITIFFYS